MLSPRVHYRRTIELETDVSMNKGDYRPDGGGDLLSGRSRLQCLARVNDLKLGEIAAAISLLSMPWIAS
jgi:hypothetical protein